MPSTEVTTFINKLSILASRSSVGVTGCWPAVNIGSCAGGRAAGDGDRDGAAGRGGGVGDGAGFATDGRGGDGCAQ